MKVEELQEEHPKLNVRTLEYANHSLAMIIYQTQPQPFKGIVWNGHNVIYVIE